MRNLSKLALSIVSTLIASSLLAQCPPGSPCYRGGSGGSYSYSSPNYGNYPSDANPSMQPGGQGFYQDQQGSYDPNYGGSSQPWMGYSGDQGMQFGSQQQPPSWSSGWQRIPQPYASSQPYSSDQPYSQNPTYTTGQPWTQHSYTSSNQPWMQQQPFSQTSSNVGEYYDPRTGTSSTSADTTKNGTTTQPSTPSNQTKRTNR